MDPNGLGSRIFYQGRKELFLDQVPMVFLPEPSQDIGRSLTVQMRCVSKDQRHKLLELRSSLADKSSPSLSSLSCERSSILSHKPQPSTEQISEAQVGDGIRRSPSELRWREAVLQCQQPGSSCGTPWPSPLLQETINYATSHLVPGQPRALSHRR